jgi:hypothetical protein
MDNPCINSSTIHVIIEPLDAHTQFKMFNTHTWVYHYRVSGIRLFAKIFFLEHMQYCLNRTTLSFRNATTV